MSKRLVKQWITGHRITCPLGAWQMHAPHRDLPAF